MAETFNFLFTESKVTTIMIKSCIWHVLQIIRFYLDILMGLLRNVTHMVNRSLEVFQSTKWTYSKTLIYGYFVFPFVFLALLRLWALKCYFGFL